MTFRAVLSGLVCLGFAACAGAETDATGDAGVAGEAAWAMSDVLADPAGWRQADPENVVLMDTTKGTLIVELLPQVAPAHVDRFKTYVRAGLYDGTPFHRVIKGFMAQGGDIEAVRGAEVMLGDMKAEFTFRRTPAEMEIDPVGPAESSTSGFYNGFAIESVARFMAEMSFDGKVETWMPHCEGVLSSARTDMKDSADAQFFLISGDGRHLDKQYTAKGRVLIGLDIVKAIKLGPTPNGYPIANPDILRKAVMLADLPEADRPAVYVERTDTPGWVARLAAADTAGEDICALPAVGAVMDQGARAD